MENLEYLVGGFYEEDGCEWESYILNSELGFEDCTIAFTHEGEIIYEKAITDFVEEDYTLNELEDAVSDYIREEHVDAENYDLEIDDDLGNMFIGENIFD